MAPVNHSMVMLLSLVIAVIFSVMPVSGDWIVWKPNFLLLVTMGWIFHRPLEFGIFFAAGVGLLADCLLLLASRPEIFRDNSLIHSHYKKKSI